jgi:hypothetical protein
MHPIEYAAEVPQRRFAACRVLPDAEGACGSRAHPTCLRCGRDVDGRRSGASFCSRSETRDRRLRCVRRHPQHRLPRAVLYALQSAQAASVLAPVAAPGTAPRCHAPRRYGCAFCDTGARRRITRAVDPSRSAAGSSDWFVSVEACLSAGLLGQLAPSWSVHLAGVTGVQDHRGLAPGITARRSGLETARELCRFKPPTCGFRNLCDACSCTNLPQRPTRQPGCPSTSELAPNTMV